MTASERPTSPPSSRRLECPRCGHELEGSARAAEARGESQGVCSECGLPVDWGKLREDAYAPRWFVEARIARWRLPRRALATLLMCARPFRFWSSVELALPISRRGIIAFVVMVAAILHLAGVTRRVADGWSGYVDAVRANASIGSGRVIADVILVAMAPLSRFNGSWIFDAIEANDRSQSDVVVLLKTAKEFVRVAAQPMRDKLFINVGTSSMPSYSRIYPELVPLLDGASPATTITAIALPPLAPFALHLLPTSLRRARIQNRHFVRISLYSCALWVPIFALALILPFAPVGHDYFSIQLFNDAPYRFNPGPRDLNPHMVLLITSGVLTALWMTAAARNYLRLPHAIGVGLATTLVTLLGLLIVRSL